MPFPILAILSGISAAVGAGSGAYGLGKAIKDNRAAKKARVAKKLAANKAQSKNKSALSNTGGASAGFTPSQAPSSFWGGSPAGIETYNQYTPQQQQAFSQVLQQALSGLGQNKFDFAPIEQQAREGFAQKTIPGIAERFTQAGAQRSSAFPQLLSQAGRGLETDLAAMKQDYGLQQQSALHNLLGIGLQPQFESLYNQGSQGAGRGLLENLLGSLLSGENISGGFGALRDLINNRKGRQKQPGASSGDAGASSGDGGQYSAPFMPTLLSPTTRLGSTSSIYNPSNIVPGTSMPSNIVPGIGVQATMPGMPTSSIGAMRGLYGI